MEKQALFETIDDERDRLEAIARDIWEHPELALHEHRSAETLMEPLETEGFEIETGIGGMPTAFVARYGEGEPVVGILGEFDALPTLSQKVTAEREPVEEGAPGHG